MYRMGLIDFWYYTNEEFYFKNGHIQWSYSIKRK